MFNLSRLNTMLHQMGQTVQWLPASACPCRASHSGAADPSCPVCLGKGWIWDAAITTSVGLTGQQIQRRWAEMGMYEAGDVVVSLPGDATIHAIGECDRVQFIQSSEPFSMVIHPDRVLPLPFTLVAIDRATVIRDGSLVDLPLPGVDATEEPQFWWGGSDDDGRPAAGESWTLTGRRIPEYFAYGNFPQDRAHEQGRALPRRVVLRKFDLFSAG
jgi:hypothetical protein